MEDRNFRNGQDYGQGYGIFWATPDPKVAKLDADNLRDIQGLVHIDKNEPVIQLHFSCTSAMGGPAASPGSCAGPTVIEATHHRRFKARITSIPMPGAGTAADLEKLRTSKSIYDGVSELVLSPVPMDAVVDARFVGFTGEHSDISCRAPTTFSTARDDRSYATMLAKPLGGLQTIVDDLCAKLET